MITGYVGLPPGRRRPHLYVLSQVTCMSFAGSLSGAADGHIVSQCSLKMLLGGRLISAASRFSAGGDQAEKAPNQLKESRGEMFGHKCEYLSLHNAESKCEILAPTPGL
ncbi:hypothetical protein FKM82_030428 [Ascaphus truei]